MKEFVSGASVRLAELEDLFVDMKARVSNIIRYRSVPIILFITAFVPNEMHFLNF